MITREALKIEPINKIVDNIMMITQEKIEIINQTIRTINHIIKIDKMITNNLAESIKAIRTTRRKVVTNKIRVTMITNKTIKVNKEIIRVTQVAIRILNIKKSLL